MISLLCPTRGRPEEFARMVKSFCDCTRGEFEVIAVTDSNDPLKAEYNKDLMTIEVADTIHGAAGTVEMWNEAAEEATGNYLMMVNDDNICNTYGWDVKLMECVPDDGIFVAWPNGQCGQCVNPIISRTLHRALGYFIPHGFNWFYADTALHALGALMGRLCYMPNVTVLSTQHKEMLPEDVKTNQDLTRYKEWLKNERAKTVKKVWKLME